MVRHRSFWVLAAASATVCLMLAGGVGLGLDLRSELATQARATRDLQSQVDALKTIIQPPDWPAIAVVVSRSVVTISTSYGLGSGWVVHSGQAGSDLVTNFHVVAEAWEAGTVVVDVAIGDRTVHGTVVRVDTNDDLAVVHIAISLPALQRAALRPRLAENVMAVGSPLGLDRTVSIGVVSGFRSVEGSDYIQFSAAISPGNSGGPVVDAHGRVIAVATAKFVSPGSEALSLAIPVQTVCRFTTCEAFQ